VKATAPKIKVPSISGIGHGVKVSLDEAGVVNDNDFVRNDA
jgi:hypothetical protein